MTVNSDFVRIIDILVQFVPWQNNKQSKKQTVIIGSLGGLGGGNVGLEGRLFIRSLQILVLGLRLGLGLSWPMGHKL